MSAARGEGGVADGAAPSDASLRCPRCRTTALTTLADRGQAFCPACRGLFVEKAALPDALGLAADHALVADARVRATLTAAPCPACVSVPLERLRLGPGGVVRFDACPRCGGAFLDGAERAGLRERVALLVAEARAPGARVLATPPPDLVGLPFDGAWIARLALPVAFAVSALLVATDLRALPEFLVNMPFHELGHATLGWFTGHLAIPLPFLTITLHERQNAAVIALVFLALAALVVAGVRTRRRYLAVLGAVGLALQVLLTFVLAHRFSGVWMSGSGVAGEYVWSTLAVVSFHYRLPDRARWDFWRWLALAVGAFGLAAVTQRWWGDVPDLAAGCPTRVGVHASEDMHVLMDEYGLGAARLLGAYHALGAACWGVVLAHYAVFLAKRRSSGVAPIG